MTQARAADTLGMPEAEMRALGHQMVEMVIDHLVGRADEKAIEVTDRASLEALIGGPVPLEPSDAASALATLRAHVIPNQQHGDHPRYFARVPSAAAFTGILGDWLATGFNSIAASWIGGSGTAVTELVVIDWLRQCMRMPEGTQGIIVSGGSLANFTAFAAAFAAKGRGVVYTNDQTHASLKRNLTAAGLSPSDIRVLKTNARQEYDVDALAQAFCKAGADLVAVSTDSLEKSRELKNNADGVKFPMPILSNPDLGIFKQHFAFDDFENTPLHGLFIIDANGVVRFQRISPDPFLDVEFVKSESARIQNLVKQGR